MSAFRRLLDVRFGERRNTFAAFATLFMLTGGHTLLETARDALFLSKLPASRLPWMYLAIVVAALGLGQLGHGRRANSRAAVVSALGFAALVTSAFWVVLDAPSRNLLYALYIWTGLFASWVTVQFWTLLGRIHTVTQAKRLYGFIGAGAVLGAVVGAMGARAAMTVLSPRSSVLIAGVVFAVAIVPTSMVHAPDVEEPVRKVGKGHKQPRRPMSAGITLLWDNAFARRVLGIALVSTIAVTLADFVFKSTLAANIKDARALGEALSGFYVITNSLALVAQLVVAPWVFRSLGVQRALFLFPSFLVVAATNVILSGGALFSALALKGLDGTFRYSIHRTSTELLLVPVPDGTRERIKPIIDLVGTRGGQALASVFVLLLVAVGAADPITVGAIVLTLSVVWVALVFTIRALYLDVFRETLRTGGLSGKAELPELDLGALETLFAGLNSSRDVEVLAALELLAEQHRERLIPALILYHPGRDVVLRALEIFTQMGRKDFVPIADRLNHHPDGEVAAAALRARTAVSPDRVLLRERLDDSGREVAVTALVALIARGWMELDEAETRISAVLEKRDWRIAAEAARAIRDTCAGLTDGPRALFVDDLLVRLADLARSLHDVAAPAEGAIGPAGMPLVPPAPADVRILAEVASAMGARRNPRFVSHLVAMLDRHELRAEARTTLGQVPGALEALDLALTAPQLPRDIRLHLPRTIATFAPSSAAPVLLRHLVHERDGSVRFKMIRALVKLRRENPELELDPGPLTSAAESTLVHVAELRRWGVALVVGNDAAAASERNADPLRAAHHLLVDLVHDKEVHATERLFMLLGLLLGEDFDDVWRGLRSQDPKRRASSVELVENVVPPPIRESVLALVGDVQPTSSPISYEIALQEMLANGSGTLRTLAEVRASELGLAAKGTSPAERHLPSEITASLGARVAERTRELLDLPPKVTRAPA